MKLTNKETDILAYIYGYIEDNKYSPTRQEIADKFKMTRQGADCFVSQLINKGKLKKNGNRWRNIGLDK